ncbi:MAG: hypothetical protein K1X79_02620 [Oligoflexia bacterium]|nr:hypothetical protein [Oligoflexia bacterium]
MNLNKTSTRWTKLLQFTCHLCAIVLVMAFGSACSKRYSDVPAYSPFPMGDYDNESAGRFKTSYIVDQIDHYYRGTNPGPIGVTTFVNVDDLYSTSTFGRMYAEQVMSELAMRGFDVIELRHADTLQFMSGRGEFAMSRDVSSVRPARQLGGVVVGTYVVSPVRVYVNARLLDPTTSVVLSAGSVEMSKSGELSRLLRGGAFPATLERIPVRHVGISTYPMNLGPSETGRLYDLEESGGSSTQWHNGGVEPKFAPPKGAKN